MKQPDPTPPRRRFRTEPGDDNRTLGDFIARRVPEAPAGFLNRLIRQGRVRINGAPATATERLEPGLVVELHLPPGSFLIYPNAEIPVSVVYEDESIAVVNKPAGLISEPGIGHKLDTLLNGLAARYGEALDRLGPGLDYGMVHRLDKDTSGLLLVARTPAAQQNLAAQFRGRTIEKTYLALVVGCLPWDREEIHIPLGRARRGGRARAITGSGEGETQDAATLCRVRERFHDTTLAEAWPKTGRWRQIRLHFEAIGHPVAGDPEHGDPAANARLQETIGLGRLFLHAAAIAFRHPATGRQVSFSAPLPPELQGPLDALRGQKPEPRSA